MYANLSNRFRALTQLSFVAYVSLQTTVGWTQENRDVTIVEVRKKLQMSSLDPVIRDYYVNAGLTMGLKPGAFINVVRKTPLADPFNQESQAHVMLPVGQMKIIYSDKLMSIGRIHIIKNSKDNPILEADVFMVGDKLDIGTIGFEKSADATGAGELKDGIKAATTASIQGAQSLQTPVLESTQEGVVNTKSIPEPVLPTQLKKAEPAVLPQKRTSASVDNKSVDVVPR